MAKEATQTAEDPRGLKRICLSCSTRFYDLNNRPIICPNCGTEYTGDVAVKGKKIEAKDASTEESQVTGKDASEDEDDDDDTIVSLEDLDEDDSDDSDEDPDLEALKEIGEDLDDADIDDEDDIDVTLDEDDK